MKIYSNRAEQFISSLKSGSLLVYGNDAGEVIEIERRIIRALLPTASDMSVVHLPMAKIKEDESVLYNEISSMSFFAKNKIIRITDAADSLTKLLGPIIPTLPPEVFVLVSADALTKTSSLRKFYEGSPKLAAILCYKDDEAEVRNYISLKFRGLGVNAEADALDYLAANLGDNKMITNNEIEKILVYLGDERNLSFEDVLSLLADSNEITLLNLGFAITSRDTKMLERNLANVFEQQQAAVAILRVVMWHFQRLITAKSMQEGGMQTVQISKTIKPPVFSKQVPEFNQALSNWSRERLVKAMGKLLEAELEAKKSIIDPELICHRTLLSLAF